MVNASGEVGTTTNLELCRKIDRLPQMTIAELRIQYRKVFGQEAKIPHKQFLLRRIAYEMQVQVLGGLSERARTRISQIAEDSDLGSVRAGGSTKIPSRMPSSLPTPVQRDPRLPPPGTVLKRRHHGRDIVVKVLEDGFEFDSERYESLSALAREVTGTRWNGLLFFGLTERRP